MVGTTERECAAPERAPEPTAGELNEIFERLERDLPGANLDRAHAYGAFAGVRTLPLRKGAENTSKLSRRHIWSYANGMVSLLGGKYTTALWTAEDGLRTAVKLAGAKVSVGSLRGRRFPGASGVSLEEARGVFSGRDIPTAVVEGAVARLGTRVRYLARFDRWDEVIGGIVLRGEIELYLHSEQVETLDDLMRRRLGFELLPGHGFAALDTIIPILKERLPGRDFDGEAAAYRSRIAATAALLRSPSIK
jgi:glycerol-3-phosphate dehydrogenase